jgi:hypothetical protein
MFVLASCGKSSNEQASSGQASVALPNFKPHEAYADIRSELLKNGWQPFHADNADACRDGDLRCQGRPEMESCGGPNCKFLWEKNNTITAICTVGEENAVFDSVCSYIRPPQSVAQTKSTEWRPGIKYLYTSDGSCGRKPDPNEVCLELASYKQACDASENISRLALKVLSMNTSGDEHDLAEAGNFSGLNIEWLPTSKRCNVSIDASGVVKGTSKRTTFNGNAIEFIVQDNGKMMVSFVDHWFGGR